MTVKQRIWLLPLFAILASVISLSANFWFSGSARHVLRDAEALHYPTVNSLDAMIAAVREIKDTLQYAVSVDDKNAVNRIGDKIAAYNAACAVLAKLPDQFALSERLRTEFETYHRTATHAVRLMLKVDPGDADPAIIAMQSAQETLSENLAMARSGAISALASNLTGAGRGLTRELIASLACAIVIVCGLIVAAILLIPTIERDAVLDGVSEYTDNAVMSADADGRITWANAGFMRMSGLDIAQVKGRTSEELLGRTESDPEASARIKAARASSNGWSEDVRSISADGREYYAHVEAQPLRDRSGANTGYIIIETDVTQRHRDADALRVARDAANEASRAKSSFLANMSHEIRTPLNGVIGMTGLLLDSDLDTQQREYAELARSSGETLLALVNDVLDFSKIEAGHISLERLDFDLIDTIESAMDAVTLRAAEKKIDLLVDIGTEVPRFIRGDTTRLRQIVVNLVGNAVKFTEQGEVHVAVSAQLSETNPLITLSVRDTGLGMTPEQQARLFRPFTQADDSTTRRFGGTGLGLSITKRLIDAMGGQITLTSQPGVGSTFSAILPFEAADRSWPASSMSLQGVLVLLAEHHPIQRSVLVNVLAMGGARVSTAPSALAAVDQLESAIERGEPPRVLLIEQGLPDQDGLWTIARMRERVGPALPPVLLLTTLGTVSDAEAKAAGCARTLLKPVKRDTLLGAMAHALNESSGAVESLKSASPTIDRKVRVLVAEDNRVNQVLMSRLLQATSQIEVAVNGLEAIERLRTGDFDLIFMDCQMPELDGYEATRRIRMGDAGANARNLPIIALTANAMSGDRERCIEAGMTDFMTKPVNPTLLRAMVEKYAADNAGAAFETPQADHPAAAS